MKKSNMNKKKILVADDDPAILEVITLILEDEGYAVTTSANGETVEKVQGELPDLILLDIWMSGMDGRDICKRLKAKPKTKHIPIVMISANKDAKAIALDAGANDFLAKPFEMTKLLAIVAKYAK
jgi:CheY-like chemotaxis protein